MWCTPSREIDAAGDIMSSHLIIFDFDGVIADSEVLANTVLAEVITELGVPTTLEDAYRLYMGKRFNDVIDAIEAAIGRGVQPTFASEFQERTFARFRKDLRLVEGARTFMDSFSDIPRCIASSSSPDRLALCLDLLSLKQTFGDHVFSASAVARGKPFPDIFLHASERMGVPPRNCIVIEDSVTGVTAGKAAGMTVIGLLAAAHIQDGHSEKLISQGADHIATTYQEVSEVMRRFLTESR